MDGWTAFPHAAAHEEGLHSGLPMEEEDGDPCAMAKSHGQLALADAQKLDEGLEEKAREELAPAAEIQKMNEDLHDEPPIMGDLEETAHEEPALHPKDEAPANVSEH